MSLLLNILPRGFRWYKTQRPVTTASRWIQSALAILAAGTLMTPAAYAQVDAGSAAGVGQVAIQAVDASVSSGAADQRSVHSDSTSRTNFLVITISALGYSDIGAFGSEIATPNLDAMAGQGVRFSRFYIHPGTAQTQAALLTGTDPHVVGLGAHKSLITKKQRGQPGYEGFLHRRVNTIAEELTTKAYRSYFSGVWHLGDGAGQGASDRGFERATVSPGIAGRLQGTTNPGRDSVLPSQPGDRRSAMDGNARFPARAYTDSVMRWLENDRQSAQPFFVWLAYPAPDVAGLDVEGLAPSSVITTYEKIYADGYEKLRQRRFGKLQNLGFFADAIRLPDWPAGVTRWDDLDAKQQQQSARAMALYSAALQELDKEIGRLIRWLKDRQQFDNTMIVFFSDSGTNPYAHDGDMMTTPAHNDRSAQNDRTSAPDALPGYRGPGWAVASAAGFRYFKGFPTEGGVRTTAIIKPAGPAVPFATHQSLVHVQDIRPTVLESAGFQIATEPDDPQKMARSRSLLPLLRGQTRAIHTGEGYGFELHGARALLRNQWKIVQMPPPMGGGEWQLYNIADDPFETRDRALFTGGAINTLKTQYDTYELRNNLIYDKPGLFKQTALGFNLLLASLCLLLLWPIATKLSLLRTIQTQRLSLDGYLTLATAYAQIVALAGLFTPFGRYAVWLLVAMLLMDMVMNWLKKRPHYVHLVPAVAIVLSGAYWYVKAGLLLNHLF